MPDGTVLYFKLANGVYTNAGTNAKITEQSGEYTLKDGEINYTYNSSGVLTKIQHLDFEFIDVIRTASSIVYQYSNDTKWTVSLDSSGKPTQIIDAKGNSVTYEYTNGNLTKFTNQAGAEIAYAYENNRLSKSDGDSIAYTSDGKIAEITGQNGAVQTYNYITSENKIVITNTAEQSVEYEYNEFLQYTKFTDEQGNVTEYDYDENGRVKSEEIDGARTEYTYDSRGNIATVTRDGSTSECSYDAENRLWREKTPGIADDPETAENESTPDEFTYYIYESGLLKAVRKSSMNFAEYLDLTTAWSTVDFINSISYGEDYSYNSKGVPTEIISCDRKDGAAVTDKNHTTTGFAYADDGLNITTTTTFIDADGVTTVQTDTSEYIGFYLKETSVAQIGTAPQTVSGRISDLTGNTLKEWTDSDTTRYVYDNQGRLVQEIGPEKYEAADDELFITGLYMNTNVGTRYVYDNVTGNLTQKTNVYDMVTAFDYDAFGNLKTQEFRDYTQNYKAWGGLEKVSIGAQTLVENTYQADTQHLLQNQAYGNGQAISYVYDEKGNITAIKYDAVTAFEYTYDYTDDANKLVEKKDYTSNIVTKYVKINDADAVQIFTMDANGNATINKLHEYYTLDRTENVTNSAGTEEEKSYGEFIESIGNTSFTTYYKDSRDIIPLSGSGAIHRDYTKRDDGALLTNNITLADGASLVNTALTYNSDSLVTSYANAMGSVNKNYEYTYDSNKNITEIKENGAVIQSYVYDSWGQLIRENDARANKTYVYNYDSFGNLLSKNTYDYTTGELGAVTDTDTCTYGDANWTDLLTEFNGQSIVYDQIGNPTEYLGWDMTWQAGRQLASASKPDTAVSYKYDDSGIRTSKTVNGVETRYTTIDGRITSQTTGNDLLYFYYDSDNSLFGFDYNGNKYLYVKNLQGDIVGIVDNTGALVVEYAYDAWGKTISQTGTLAEVNPFRYRGYYWDSETQLYYLQSRYYDSLTKRFINADDPALLDQLMSADEVLGSNLFAYCNNDPVNMSDSEGDFPGANLVVGAVIGAVLGAVGYLVGIVFSNILSGKSPFYNFGNQISGKGIAIAILFGALDGAIAVSSISAIWGRVAGAVSSGIQAAVSGEGAFEIVLSVIIGAVFSGAGAGNKTLQKFNFNRASSALKKLDKKGIKHVISEISKAIKYAIKSNKTLYGMVGKKVFRQTPKSLLATFGLAGLQASLSSAKKKLASLFGW
jgi:RHS repeat-associated protein